MQNKFLSDTSPKRKELRRFGLLLGMMFPLLFGLVFPYWWSRPWPIWPWLISAPFLLLALTAPQMLSLPHRIWMTLGSILGAINSRIILGILFYLIFTPVGGIRRFFNKDSIVKKPVPQTKSYWVESKKEGTQFFERPF